MNRFAVMQGRLVPPEEGRFQSFPRTRWREEFRFAASAGLNAIEWIYDSFGEDLNPLASSAGLDEMRHLSAETGISIRSLCADYFMEHPFLRTSSSERSKLIKKMEWLFSRSTLIGISHIVVPFVDASSIKNDQELRQAAEIINELVPCAMADQIELHLEASLPPHAFAQLLDKCANPSVRINYDSGNSASLGYRVEEEFAAYGDRIGSVHIKDRVLGGGTVPLGTGNANLDAVFKGLAKLGYQGDFVLQIARATPGDEIKWIAQNLIRIKSHIEAANASAQ